MRMPGIVVLTATAWNQRAVRASRKTLPVSGCAAYTRLALAARAALIRALRRAPTSERLHRGLSMAAAGFAPLEGACTCGAVRYRMTSPPLFVHCCHCRWCQRETGAAFALNAMIEADRVVLEKGQPETVHTPSNSGKGQKIVRCPTCRVALWSHYAGAGDAVCFVRVGTLVEPDRLPPDIHIFTASKQPWVMLSPATPAVTEYYDRNDYWPKESLERRRAMLARRAGS
jgi:hypothetical protein